MDERNFNLDNQVDSYSTIFIGNQIQDKINKEVKRLQKENEFLSKEDNFWICILRDENSKLTKLYNLYLNYRRLKVNIDNIESILNSLKKIIF